MLVGIDKYVPASPTRIDSLYADLQSQMIGQLEQQKVFQESVKSMMEMEYAKIQNEYESQEIWIGLITIVFLIFSFYSMMKSEQFERQCQEDAKRAHDLTETATTKIEGINTAGETKLKAIDDSFKKWKETSNATIKSDVERIVKEELEPIKQEIKAQFKEIEKKWDDKLSKQVQKVMASLNTFEEATKKKCGTRVTEFLSITEKKAMIEVNRLLDNIDDSLSNVDGLIDRKIDKYIEEHTVKPEDIDKKFEDVFGPVNLSETINSEETNDKTEIEKPTHSDDNHEK